MLIQRPMQKGYLWVFPSSFVVEKGEGTLKDYLFSNKTTTHKVRLKAFTLCIWVALTGRLETLTGYESSVQFVERQ